MSTGVPISISTTSVSMGSSSGHLVAYGAVLLDKPSQGIQTFTIDVILPADAAWQLHGASTITATCADGATTCSFTMTLEPTSSPPDRTTPWAALVVLRRTQSSPPGSPGVATILRLDP